MQAATERDGAGAAPQIGAPGFTGRARELAALTSALAGPPAVVLVEGEAGIGKTRLLREFQGGPAGRARRVLVACCPPFRQPQTLGPVADAIRQAAGGVRGLRLSPLAGALRPLFPEWAADLPPAPEPAEDATAARHRVFRALAELAGCLGAEVMVAEDVHWADEATLEFLLFLASRQPRQLSVVVTCRPEDVPAGSLLPRLSRLAAGGGGLRLALGPLAAAGTAAMVSSMLAGERLSAGFAALVHERTEGIPLAVEESVRLMADRADLARRDGEWVRLPLAEIDVPPTIRDAVLERAGRLRRDAQAVLRAAAVLTEPAAEATVAAVAEIPPERARAGLSAAIESGLLAEDRGALVAFRHMLACRAVYEAIPAPHRRAMHLRAGTALERVSSPPTAALARHFREAGETTAWCRYAEQAADMALTSGDEAAATALLYDLIVNADLPAQSVAGLTKKIPFASFTSSSRYRDLVGALRAVLVRGKLMPADEARLRLQLGRVLLQMEEHEAGRVELERAIPHLKHGCAEAVRAMAMLGWPDSTACPASAHLGWLRRAEPLAERMAPADRLWHAVERVGALLKMGEETGWTEAARIPADSSVPEEKQLITKAHLNIGNMAMMWWGRYAEAERRLARALHLAEDGQYLRYRNLILVTQAHLDWFTGTWDGLAERVHSLADNEDIQPVTRSEAILVAGLLHAAGGRRLQAGERLQFVHAEAISHGFAEYSMEQAAVLARLALADGCVDDALKVTEAPIGLVADKGIWVWATDLAPVRIDALAAAGRTLDATRLLTAFSRGLRGRDAPGPKAALALCRAIVAEGRGDHARAAALYAHAAIAWQALPRPYDALLARERQARCLLTGDRPEAGLTLLGEIRDALLQLGAIGDADRVARCLREHGVDGRRLNKGRPSYGARLSPKEVDVVRLLVTGQTNKEIASTLFLSPKTIERHVYSAMRKLHCASRTTLAVTALRDGFL